MIRFRRIPNEFNPAPHAIFWRPLTYFANTIRSEKDSLDLYDAASFEIGNDIIFDLRHYHAHPEFTVTFYLDAGIQDDSEIQGAITRAVEGFRLPKHAIAWRRGDPFTSGELERTATDRLSEKEAKILVLKIAARSKDHSATMSDIQKQIPTLYPLTSADKRPSPSRKNEQVWQQIVRNVISHNKNSQSLFMLGWAIRHQSGIKITPNGFTYLKSIGFSD